MRVLHVLNSLERSGAEVMLVQAAPLFREQGVELDALATGEGVGAYAGHFTAAGFVVHHVPFRPSPMFFARLYGLVRRSGFDVVHVHTERSFFWYELVARLARVPVVVRSVHSVFDFTGPLWGERWIQRRLAHCLFRERSVAVSTSVQEAEERVYGLRPVRINNWTDTEKFTPIDEASLRMQRRRDLGLGENDFVLISVGACHPVKNHSGIIRALSSTEAHAPRTRYIHVGSGALEESEMALADELDVREKVLFFGERDDVALLLQSCDAFVMPSLREGMSISCLEAMSCGLPVIAADAPGLRDLVVDGVTGILVKGQDELAQALVRLHAHPSLRAEMGAAGRARVISEFDVETSVQRYIELYGSVLGKALDPDGVGTTTACAERRRSPERSLASWHKRGSSRRAIGSLSRGPSRGDGSRGNGRQHDQQSGQGKAAHAQDGEVSGPPSCR